MLSLGVMLPSTSFALNAAESVTIQAESYTRAATGVQKETTTDAGGGQNVGYFDTGRWLTYDTTAALNLPCEGSYKIEYRVASPNNGGALSFMKDGGTPVFGELAIPNTGGYQAWQTISHNVTLPKGTLPYTIFSKQGGWNINWFRITAPSCVPPVDPNVARWLIDSSKSSFNFVSVKKNIAGTETGENFTFNEILGTVGNDGKASLVISLNSIFTNNETREGRMKTMLFETVSLPKAYFQTQLDLTAVEGMAVGTMKTLPISGTLTLHGITKPLVFDATVVKHSSTSLSLSPRKPILINTVDFEMNYGIQLLKGAVGLASIGQVSPVYFNIQLTRENPTNRFVLLVPTAPAAPVGLLGNIGSTSAKVNFMWTDVSTNETSFLLRRKGFDGIWQTVGTVPANEISYSPSLENFGTYDYKLIALNDSVPSAPSNIEALTYVRDNSSQIAHGEELFKRAGSCQSCHSDDNGDGYFKGSAPINVNSFVIATAKGYQTDTIDGLANFISREMGVRVSGGITLAESTDIASWLWSLRGQIEITDGLACSINAPVYYAPRTIKLLTSYEYGNSLQALFPNNPLPKNYGSVELALSDASARNIPSHATIKLDGSRLENYKANAEEIADWAVTNRTLPFSCSNSQDATCQTNFVNLFANKAMRRPLTSTEAANYKAIVAASPTGLKVAVQTLLMSPQFLYRTELGVDVATASNQTWGKSALFTTVKTANNGAYALDPYEFASTLSYMYTGSSPDAALIQAAESGDLYVDSTLSAQIDRLMDSPKGREHTARFGAIYAGTDKLSDAVRNDLSGANKFTPDVKASMSEEIRQIYSNVFYGNKPLSDLFAGNFTVLNKTLSDYYNIPSNSTSPTDWQVVDTSTLKRGGILASGAYMAMYAHTTHTSPIKRAVHIRQDFLCQDIPLPTSFEDPQGLRQARLDEINAKLKTTGLTTAQYYHELTTTPGSICLECHMKMINPLFSMDDFDNVGRLRSVVNGQVVQNLLTANVEEKGAEQQIDIVNAGGRIFAPNQTGKVSFFEINALPDSAATPFKGSKELSKLFVTNDAVGVKSCFINKAYRYTTGLPINSLSRVPEDAKLNLNKEQQSNMACIEKSIFTNVNNSSNPKALMKKIGMEPALRFRR